jgi:TusA-related sulfurtransferase
MAKHTMREIKAGESLCVLCTDPEAPIDLGAWASEFGHSYSQHATAGWIEFVICKSTGH